MAEQLITDANERLTLREQHCQVGVFNATF